MRRSRTRPSAARGRAPRSVTVRTASSHTCTARGVKRRAISPRSSSWRGGSMSIIDLRASIWSGSRSSSEVPPSSERVELDVAVDLADVVVAGDRPEARGRRARGSSGRGPRARRVANHSCGTRVDERVVVGEVDLAAVVVMAFLEVVEVLVDLPVRDPRAVALDLEALDGQERVDDLGPDARRAGRRRPRARRARRRASAGSGAPRRRRRGRRRRRRAAASSSSSRDAVQAGEQHRGDRQVRVRAAVADADLDPRRAAALGRDADEASCGCPSPSWRASARASRARCAGRR